jgi:hypothetical protein
MKICGARGPVCLTHAVPVFGPKLCHNALKNCRLQAISIFGCENRQRLSTHAHKFNLEKRKRSKPAPRCHRVTRRAGCQKATMESSLRDLQSLSHLHYQTDTHQLTSPQGEADGVSKREYDVAGVGGGECALWLVPR